MLRTLELRKPYDGAKDYFYIEDIDDHDYMKTLVTETCKALSESKFKRK